MATRGFFQLKKLTLSYCEKGGSSKAVREFLASGKLQDWAQERPHVDIHVKVKNGKHPNVVGDYLTTQKGTIHQICLKSNKVRSPDVIGALDKLYNRSGRKIKKLTSPVVTQTPSVQGVWTPAVDLHLQQDFAVSIRDA
mmetsp:Transcript_7342/g.19854  ORF Transcript_7342/g.19854 Transcript_7342/m.19854 type:complete len:139 (-) Transcript_7342:527-943(-)